MELLLGKAVHKSIFLDPDNVPQYSQAILPRIMVEPFASSLAGGVK